MSLNKLPKVASSSTVYEGFFRVRRDLLTLPSRELYPYDILETAPFAVMVLATTPEGNYVVSREYRHPTQSFLLSCPGGIKMEEESAEECANRELREETGFTASTFQVIGEAFPFPGVTDQKTIYMRALNATREGPQALEAAEFIEPVILSEKELKTEILEGAPVDGLLLTALFFNSLQP